MEPITYSSCSLTESSRVISPEDLALVLNGEHEVFCMHKTAIIDCRYPYEFEGGHIAGAHHIWKKDELHDFFENGEIDSEWLLVFHCEYSQKRGPKTLKTFIDLDRRTCTEFSEFGLQKFEHCGILEGGYRRFYELYPEHCNGGYITQDDGEFEQIAHCCDREHHSSYRILRSNSFSNGIDSPMHPRRLRSLTETHPLAFNFECTEAETESEDNMSPCFEASTGSSEGEFSPFLSYRIRDRSISTPLFQGIDQDIDQVDNYRRRSNCNSPCCTLLFEE
ncbi:hypothetical protein PCE1_000979 [Barthelona sp. PCE]